MLHLLLVGRDDACTSHHEPTAATAALTSAMSVAMSADMPTRGAASPSHHENDSSAPTDCTATNGTRCCDAVGSCTMSVATASSVCLCYGVLSASGAFSLTQSDIDSVWTSPEPPPPKA